MAEQKDDIQINDLLEAVKATELWNKPLVWKKNCQCKVMYLVQYDPWTGMK